MNKLAGTMDQSTSGGAALPQTDLIATRIERRDAGNVAYVTVTNEARRNALPVEGRLALANTMKAIGHDPDLRVVVLSGAGDKSFIGGANINEIPMNVTTRGQTTCTGLMPRFMIYIQ